MKLSAGLDVAGPQPADDWQNGGFGIYVHWPFCQSKCPYCDFNSHVAGFIDQAKWRDAYLRDLDRTALETGGRMVDSVFFGGGTPSLMHPDTVAAILDRIRQHWRPRNSCEVTLEANPGSVEAGRFQGYRDAGVNRISIGVQSLTERGLRELGRLHDVSEARSAIALAQSMFSKVSFDLIYARQNQTPDEWSAELEDAISLGTDHLSLYQLTIEPGTPFHTRQMAGGLRGLPTEDRSVELYELTQERCSDVGLLAYEVSNHARQDAESVHNRIYWKAGDYLGIGPGAHGRLTIGGERTATEAVSAPRAWLDRIREGITPDTRKRLSPQEMADEYMLMGLRLEEGVSVARLEYMLGRHIDISSVADLEEMGLISTDGRTLRASYAGRLLLNSVIKEVSAALN